MPTLFSLDVRRARKGDCLMLHFGESGAPGLMLIDGGPTGVYEPELKPRLEEIRMGRELEEEDRLQIDVLMVSHIDDDHIKGILEFTDELVVAADADQPQSVIIHDLWHNTIDDVLADKPDRLVRGVEAAFGTAAISGEIEVEGFEAHTGMVLASIPQGVHLRDDARKLKIPVNRFFGGKAIRTTDGQAKPFKQGVKLTTVGPLEAELAALRKDFEKYQRDHPEVVAKIPASFTDTSVANLSSLVFLVELNGKRILLTGDARGDKIVAGLEATGLLAPGGKMEVDIFKIPHHGSDRDLETSVFEKIVAKHYVFSGDGEHGNPERETFEMMRKACEGRTDAFTIHLTYSLSEIDAARKKEWENQRGRDESRRKKNPDAHVRPEWNDTEHSLTAFFEEHPELKNRLSFVEKGKPHVIDLLDPLGY